MKQVGASSDRNAKIQQKQANVQRALDAGSMGDVVRLGQEITELQSALSDGPEPARVVASQACDMW